jgi:hypothetical protein
MTLNTVTDFSRSIECYCCKSTRPHPDIIQAHEASDSLKGFLARATALPDVIVECVPPAEDSAGFEEGVAAKVRFWCQTCEAREGSPLHTQLELSLDNSGRVMRVSWKSQK